MSIHVFLGPTLAVEQAREHLAATYHPPVEQGDVLRVLASAPTMIGIIDGYFERVPSVWHKEILVALRSHVRVLGAASMGALRAAELHPFGMVGIGRIFEWFRSGQLEDDDEVAVVHAPADLGYRPLSEAMVNIRDAVNQAVGQAVVPAEFGEKLVAVAKSLHYSERSFPRLLAEAAALGADAHRIEALKDFLRTYGPSLKERDAIELLEAMAALAREPVSPPGAHFEVEDTVFLRALVDEVSNDDAPAHPVGETIAVARKKALLRLLARGEAERRGLELAAEEIQVQSDNFRTEFGLATAEETAAWLAAAELTVEAFRELMRDAALIRRLESVYGDELNRALIDQARLSSVRLRSTHWHTDD